MPNPSHPTLARVKQQFPSVKLLAAQFRNQTSLIVPADHLHAVLSYLRNDPASAYDFLSDVMGIDYMDYPAARGDTTPHSRFAVIYNLVSTTHNHRLFIKVLLDPSLDTTGIEHDPALHLPTVCDLWPGAEWPEREVFDMLGIRFDSHPDLRRILTWESYPAHPLRKDYPLRGRGEREGFKVINRDSA